MKASHFEVSFILKAVGKLVPRLALSLALAAAVVTSAVAGTPCDQKKDTYKKVCKDGNIPDCAGAGALCRVTIPDPNHPGTVTASPDPVCVERGAVVQWIEATANDYFTVTFSQSTPFWDNQTSFPGSYGQPSHPDTIGANAQDCYQYTINQCDNAGHCTPYDPKVIVNGAGPAVH